MYSLFAFNLNFKNGIIYDNVEVSILDVMFGFGQRALRLNSNCRNHFLARQVFYGLSYKCSQPHKI